MGRQELVLANNRLLWEQPDLWNAAAAFTGDLHAEMDSVVLNAGDPPLDDPNLNYHVIRVGTEGSPLTEMGPWSWGAVKRTCGFCHDSAWADHRDWLDRLFEVFFASLQASPGWVGYVSLVAARRPAHLRHEQDPRARVEQLSPSAVSFAPHTPHRYGKLRRIWKAEGGSQSVLQCGHIRIPTTGLTFASGKDRAKDQERLIRVTVPRRLRSVYFDHNYHETWYMLGTPGRDDDCLKRGRLPAVPIENYQGSANRLRSAPMLNLLKLHVPTMTYCGLAVEIDRTSGGEISSLRTWEFPLAVGLLCAVPTEYLGLCEAFQKLHR